MKLRKSRLARFARRFSIGSRILKARQIARLGIRRHLAMMRGRQRLAPLIARASPIAVYEGNIEIHMLLHHARVYEGVWAIYSFLHHSRVAARVAIHDDGSLTASDRQIIDRVLPGSRIIGRAEADLRAEVVLGRLALRRTLQLRRTLVFALKLIDVRLFAEAPNIVILDSDVLFFARPGELLDDITSSDGSREGVSRYSLDLKDNYCLSDARMTAVMGARCIACFNPGVMRVPSSAPSLTAVEQWLGAPEFWDEEERGNYFAELSLWAMDLTLRGARALPSTYVLAPNSVDDDSIVSAHFCGGTTSTFLYYTDGLSRAAADIGLS